MLPSETDQPIVQVLVKPDSPCEGQQFHFFMIIVKTSGTVARLKEREMNWNT